MFPRRSGFPCACLPALLTTSRTALARTVAFIDATKPYGDEQSGRADAGRCLRDGLQAAGGFRMRRSPRSGRGRVRTNPIRG